MRTAIFGGTFDPIHTAHTRVAAEAADRFELDRVLFVPSAHPPHKLYGQTTSFAHRYRMVELACAGDRRFVPSRIEERTEVSYSIDTIMRVKAEQGPGDSLFFLIGADAFAEIGSWRRSGEVIRAVDFIVASRPGYTCPTPGGARVHFLETLALGISSSEIRRRLESGGDVPELHPEVFRYIRQQGLYR